MTRCIAVISAFALAAPALAQADSEARETTARLLPLFRQSLDVFTIVLVLGSLVGAMLITKALLEVRGARLVGARSARAMRDLAGEGNTEDLLALVARENTIVAEAVGAALRSPRGTRGAMRETAELAASERVAQVMRGIDPINLIGNLAPLVGLAGTVWGMILAFTSLGATGGQADPTTLSVGISKALFHTLLGLVLAIPCLLAFGLLRGRADRLCTRALVLAGEILEMLPERIERGAANSPGGAGASPSAPPARSPARASPTTPPPESTGGAPRWDDGA